MLFSCLIILFNTKHIHSHFPVTIEHGTNIITGTYYTIDTKFRLQYTFVHSLTQLDRHLYHSPLHSSTPFTRRYMDLFKVAGLFLPYSIRPGSVQRTNKQRAEERADR